MSKDHPDYQAALATIREHEAATLALFKRRLRELTDEYHHAPGCDILATAVRRAAGLHQEDVAKARHQTVAGLMQHLRHT